MSQSKRATLIETISSIAIGMLISTLVGFVIYPLFGHAVSLAQSFWITVIFTITSFIRMYFLRRFFNHLHTKGILQ